MDGGQLCGASTCVVGQPGGQSNGLRGIWRFARLFQFRLLRLDCEAGESNAAQRQSGGAGGRRCSLGRPRGRGLRGSDVGRPAVLAVTGQRIEAAGGPSSSAGLASALVRTARAALGVTAEQMAAVAGCDEMLVADIESGRLDPTLDTVGRLVSSVGLEVRAGPGPEPDDRYVGVDGGEAQRLGTAYDQECELAAQFGAGPPGPLAGTQREWDGADPAPPHLFGAGPTRRDGGGWSALVVKDARSRLSMTQKELAAAAGLEACDVAWIESGAVKLTVGELQAVLAAMGASLVARLEVYDAHDDALHLSAVSDPQGYRNRIAAAKEALGDAVALG